MRRADRPRPSPSTFARLSVIAALTLAGCAHMPWAKQPENTETAHAGPLPPGDDGDEPPPAPFSSDEKVRISRVHPIVAQASTTYELDPNLIHAVIWVESRHQPDARSPAGARGLMQLMPATAHGLAKEMGRTRPRIHDPEFNVMAGSRYLSHMLERYEGDEALALAAYNAGAGNIDKWLRDEGLPPRSVEYIELVMDARRRFEALNGEWSMPIDDTPATTMIARAEPKRAEPEPEPHVPEPPKAAPAPKPAPEPVAHNPLAPEPGVYRPTPPPEPPLFDTPAPPRERAHADRPAPAPSRPSRPAEVTDDSLPAPPSGLPGILD